jgi:hypothetical protein
MKPIYIYAKCMPYRIIENYKTIDINNSVTIKLELMNLTYNVMKSHSDRNFDEI